jgi:hypothetical protein
MAKKETYYFSHDYNARNDEKIIELIMVHGMVGYGVYWSIVENLYNNANALQTHYKRIAFELRVTEKVVTSVINDFKLFTIDGDIFYSKSVADRLGKRTEISDKAREAAFARWNKDANAMQPHSESNAPAMQRKVKESKGNKKKESTIPSFFDFYEYAKTLDGFHEQLEKPIKTKYDSWVANDWKDGKDNKITNWKSKLINTMPYIVTANPPTKSTFKYPFPR